MRRLLCVWRFGFGVGFLHPTKEKSMSTSTITCKSVPEHQRLQHTAKLFGLHFPRAIEPTIYNITDSIAEDYNGGYWEFYELSNGGFYMSPKSDKPFQVSCENGFEGEMSADTLGISVCLYAYSLFSFSRNPGLAKVCARQYHLLRDYMLDHSDARAILAAID